MLTRVAATRATCIAVGCARVRLLHIGSGFRPLRFGGLVAYTEDLMREQVARGHDVTYLFSGRYYPFVSGPRLRRWERSGVAMLEVVNSPLYDHGRQPVLELDEPRTERMFARVLGEVRPDVVHFHELAGLPTSLLDIARDAGVRTVFTLQDYFPLCSTFKLIDRSGQVCLLREIGADCVATVAADKRRPGVLFEQTVRFELMKRPLTRRLAPDPPHERIERIARSFANRVEPPPPARAEDFQRRRALNVERMNRTDLLVAMSTRVAEIYAQLGVDPARIRATQLTLAHIERLRPRAVRGTAPVTFGTLNGMASTEKGARLLVEAVRLLSRDAPPGSFRLLVYGHVDPAVAADAEALDAIDLRRFYFEDELDELLDEVDVGIVPSIWEEAYGYVGMEFIAKGIPVIANAIGGMVDYTREGETGWLNKSLTAEELARTMRGIVDDPGQVADLNARMRRDRDKLVKTVAGHAGEMDAIYTELTGASTQLAG